MAVEIIAEVAQGYEGNPTLAKLLAQAAIRVGADAVKYQLIYADEIATPSYQYHELFRGLEMPETVWQTVATNIKSAGVKLYFDIFGDRSLNQAIALEADGVKIHTTDFYNTPLVRRALAQFAQVFISIGGISCQELQDFLIEHQLSPSPNLCFMYGFQAEPTAIPANHLLRLRSLKTQLPEYQFGFMDHSDGQSDAALTLALMALPLGISSIEKHLSLDPLLQLEDYLSALPPQKFQQFVQQIRTLEPALGSEDLTLTAAETEYRQKAMKVVVAERSMRQGEQISPQDVSLKRTPPSPTAKPLHRLEQAIGRTLTQDMQQHQLISEDFLQ